MKRNAHPEATFQTLRNLPVELDLVKTEAIIAGVAATQISWLVYLKLHIKSILMFPIITTIVVSSSLFIASPETPDLAGQAQADDFLSTSLVYDRNPVTPLEPIQIDFTNLVYEDPFQLPEIKLLPPALVKVDTVPEIKKEESSVIIGSGENTIIGAASSASAEGSIFSTGEGYLFSNENQVYLETPRIGKLKKELIREMLSDGLMQNKKDLVMIQLREDRIIVNDEVLGKNLYTKYQAIADKYEIEPGPDRVISFSPKYIMVGDLTDDGFSGSAHGRVRLGDN